MDSLGGQAPLSRGAGRLSRCCSGRAVPGRVPGLLLRGSLPSERLTLRERLRSSFRTGSGVILFISFDLSLKRKERGKWRSYKMLLLQVDVRVRGSSSGSLALISSRDTLS